MSMYVPDLELNLETSRTLEECMLDGDDFVFDGEQPLGDHLNEKAQEVIELKEKAENESKLKKDIEK